MKKRINIVIVLVLCFVAQSFAQKQFKVGLNLGGHYADLNGFKYPVKSDFEIGLSYGISLEYMFNEKFSIVTGFNTEKWIKKNEITYFDNQANQTSVETLKESHHFFNIPILVRYKFGSKQRFFVDGGGFINYFNKAEPNEFYPLFINFEDYNYGLAFGLGTIFQFKNNTDITIHFRNDFGLADVNKNKDTREGNIKTNTVRLIATYNLAF